MSDSEWSRPAGLKLAQENLQSKVKEEDSITNVETSSKTISDIVLKHDLCELVIAEGCSAITNDGNGVLNWAKKDFKNLQTTRASLVGSAFPSTHFNKTTPMVTSLASHISSKGKSQLGAIKIGASASLLLSV
nr:hypothetical protein [Tanacetum cinerariifolium]